MRLISWLHAGARVALPLLVALPLEARVVSYAPVTSRSATPAVQKRTNRRFALVESADVSGVLGYIKSLP